MCYEYIISAEQCRQPYIALVGFVVSILFSGLSFYFGFKNIKLRKNLLMIRARN